MICGILTNSNLEQVKREDEDGPMIHLPSEYYNQSPYQNRGKPWIDSGLKHGNDGTQLVLAGSIDERKKQDKTKDITEVSLDLMYKNQREVYKTKGEDANSVLDYIKEIEEKSFRKEQKVLQNVKNYKEVAQSYGINPDRLQVHTNADHDWYMIFEERRNTVYIADLAAIGGKHSEGEDKTNAYEQSLEIMESLFELMQKAAQENKSIYLNATEDTSYKSVLSMARDGIVTINYDNERQWRTDSSIKIHDMSLTVDLEKVTERLEKVKRTIARRKDKDYDRE